MKIIDTVVLVSSNDPTHRLHNRANHHLLSLSHLNDVFLPTVVLMEYAAELKTHGFSPTDRENIFRALGLIIPDHKLLPVTPAIHANAIQYERLGGWFDSLIASTALEHNAIVISTDSVFDQIGVPRIW